MENPAMSLRTAVPEKNPLYSVPPIFASTDGDQDRAMHPPGNPEPASKASGRSEATADDDDDHRQSPE
jgi:hypothetical protein